MPHITAIRLLIVLAVLSVGCVSLRGGEPHTIGTNLKYHLLQGDLAGADKVVASPDESGRTLRIIDGGQQLLQTCRDNPDRWQLDPLLFRFGHRHPGSSIGCRERSSPSMHMVFYRAPGGVREARIHFDLYGPQNTFGHATEVVRNRMTFGRTSEYEVHRGLVRISPADRQHVPPPRYDVAAHARQYLRTAFGPGAIGMAIASGAASSAMHNVTGRGPGALGLTDRVSTNLIRTTLVQSIEFGAAAFVQQEQGFSPSGEHGFGRRARSALYRSLFVPGRGGDELAFPRIAAAIGTPWAMRQWHPGRETAPDPWVQAALLFGRYIARSYWTEFKPDIMRALRKALHRADSTTLLMNATTQRTITGSSQLVTSLAP